LRRAAKRDTVEASIVGALRKTGWSVEFMSIKDAPDLLLGLHGMTYLAEVKTGKAKLRPGQFIWHAQWGGSPVIVLRSVDDALALREKLESGNYKMSELFVNAPGN
jgi:hypothetical protein